MIVASCCSPVFVVVIIRATRLQRLIHLLQGQVLDVVAQRVADAGLNVVCAFAKILGDEVARVVEDVDNRGRTTILFSCCFMPHFIIRNSAHQHDVANSIQHEVRQHQTSDFSVTHFPMDGVT
jgi:hypothetical protein